MFDCYHETIEICDHGANHFWFALIDIHGRQGGICGRSGVGVLLYRAKSVALELAHGKVP